MSLSLTIQDKASPLLKSLPAGVDPHKVAMVGGRALTNELRGHLFKLDRERPNELGGERTHFYAQVARSVQQPRGVPAGAMVSINHVAARQRLEGGTIEPVHAERLTIPARAEYYGKRAREFHNLHYVRFRSGTEALVESDATLVSFHKTKLGTRVENRGETGGAVAYWLKLEVHQDPDPTVLPTEEEMQAAVTKGASAYVNRLIERRSGVALN